MSARKWFYKLQATLKKWFRPPLEVSIANASLDWMFERGKEVQAQLYQAQHHDYLERPHCFRHGSPVPLRETKPGQFECPYQEQHSDAASCPHCQRPLAQIGPGNWFCEFCATKPNDVTVQRLAPGVAEVHRHLPPTGVQSVTTRTAGEFAREATGKPYHHTEWPTTDKVQAPAWDEMKRYGSGQ